MAIHDAKMDAKDEKEMQDVMRNKDEAYIPPKEPEKKEPEPKDNEFSVQI